MLEQAIQKKIINEIHKLPNSWVVKVISANKNGCPDILACVDGKFVAIEVKTKQGAVSKLQHFQINKIKEAGGYAFIARSVEDIEKNLKNILK